MRTGKARLWDDPDSPDAACSHVERVLAHVYDNQRRRRLAHIGFPPDEAAELSALHTRNFM
jgi:hypothetical protein